MIATACSQRPASPRTKSLLSPADFQLVQEGFRAGLSAQPALERHLRGVIHDTLSHPGSLARAQLAFSLLKALGFDAAIARDVGVAIEYYHTASLLFDDLPCMDNASTRRGHACPHTVHGESAAILGALSLITKAYALLWPALNHLPAERRTATSALVEECLGLHGILNGQAYDLHYGESGKTEQDVLRIARGKTVTLIRLTLLLPALMRGADTTSLKLLEQLAEHWGLAYQILDDFKDGLLNEAESGKTVDRDALLNRPNLPKAMGAPAALNALDRHLGQARAAIERLQRRLPRMAALDRLQWMMEQDRDEVMVRLQAVPRATTPAPA
ncbi:MAG: polyprenyl synthetase family protein [Verrucomicrobia bacterium]|nr:polyprenyl synthetase family protein [Kiritimatiellia bacterium]MCP5489236.1 polyprenyl synthetase family protein [Verrucomicrobiota bacterium]